jgi:DNA polymerase III delta subunit
MSIMLYIIKGDETLLIEEAIDNILKIEKNTEKKIFEIIDPKTFEAALFALKSRDFFSSNPVNIFKISDKTYKALQKNLKKLPPDTQTITVLPVTLKQFPRWLEKKFQQTGYIFEAPAKDLLCTFLEGNIFAAKQCLEKLKLIYPDEKILTEKQLLDVLTPSARYNIYDLMNHLNHTQLPKISVILKNLFSEGVEPAIILWGLLQEGRKRRKAKVLSLLVEADEIIKGIRTGSIFEALERSAFAIAGKTLL